MFTGIIEQVGSVTRVDNIQDGLRLFIDASFDGLTVGESIAVNGVCLTLLSSDYSALCFDVSTETCACTRLASLRSGDWVNLERAMVLGARFGGHYVSGHVDTVVKLLKKESVGDFVQCRIGPFLKTQLGFLLPKGSITLDGVSLTINHVGDDWIDFMLIPQTLAHTGFNLLDLDHQFNVEFDYLARIVVNELRLKTQESEVL